MCHGRHHHHHHNHYGYPNYAPYHHQGRFSYGCVFTTLIGILVVAVVIYLIKREQRKKKDLNRNSVVLITEGTKGVGRELALTVAKNHKCNIILFDSNADQATDLLQEIHNLGAKGFFYQFDFRNKDIIAMTIAQVLAEFSQIDLFIHTGGMALEKTFDEYCYEDMLAVMEANFFGPTILLKEILVTMKARNSGHIVSVPSDVAYFTSSDVYSYCGIKSAIGKMLQGMQGELASIGSKVKITIVGSSMAIGKSNKDELDQAKIRRFANKIYRGIMYQSKRV